MSILKKLFGIKVTDYNELIKEGAIVIDVRSKGEFNSGHISGATNVPLDKIKSKSVIIITNTGIEPILRTSRSVLNKFAIKSKYNL